MIILRRSAIIDEALFGLLRRSSIGIICKGFNCYAHTTYSEIHEMSGKMQANAETEMLSYTPQSTWAKAPRTVTDAPLPI